MPRENAMTLLLRLLVPLLVTASVLGVLVAAGAAMAVNAGTLAFVAPSDIGNAPTVLVGSPDPSATPEPGSVPGPTPTPGDDDDHDNSGSGSDDSGHGSDDDPDDDDSGPGSGDDDSGHHGNDD